MIYIYNKEGKCTKYNNSNIPIILKYDVYKYGEKEENKQDHCVYVACNNWEYSKDWIHRNEYTAWNEISCSFMRTPYWCIRDCENDWAYWSRTPIRINPDNTIDYYFYYNGKNNIEPYINEYEWEEKTGLYCKY